ncbi:hypothetical protein GCM10008959_18860 [Deinococcus seoulensis]|uniref:Uncharacterized protein n=1 Tax=Deinococcus seoulensis TaxID=1837379 RepID=A0ABQ2RR04_9DEIO|nr:hypothetical protein GCM10008959_18860 [Deinococcus seoulensis]
MGDRDQWAGQQGGQECGAQMGAGGQVRAFCEKVHIRMVRVCGCSLQGLMGGELPGLSSGGATGRQGHLMNN